MMKRKNFTELTFKEIVDSILKESVEEIDDFAVEAEEEDTDVEADDEFDVSDFETEEEDTDAEAEGDVSVTLTLDEISVLRSIMAKIDAVSSEDEDMEDDELEIEDDEDEDIEISEEDDTEDAEDDADIPVPSEEEETVLGDGKGDSVITIANKGVSRKKGTPAVDRSGAHKEGLMGTPRAAGNADTVELSNVGVSRKKGTPAVNRQGKHTGTRIAPSKAVIEIGK